MGRAARGEAATTLQPARVRHAFAETSRRRRARVVGEREPAGAERARAAAADERRAGGAARERRLALPHLHVAERVVRGVRESVWTSKSAKRGAAAEAPPANASAARSAAGKRRESRIERYRLRGRVLGTHLRVSLGFRHRQCLQVPHLVALCRRRRSVRARRLRRLLRAAQGRAHARLAMAFDHGFNAHVVLGSVLLVVLILLVLAALAGSLGPAPGSSRSACSSPGSSSSRSPRSAARSRCSASSTW